MIGCTRQSVNKLLGMFTDDGLIRLDRDSIVVLDLEGLTRTARSVARRSCPFRGPPDVAQACRSCSSRTWAATSAARSRPCAPPRNASRRSRCVRSGQDDDDRHRGIVAAGPDPHAQADVAAADVAAVPDERLEPFGRAGRRGRGRGRARGRPVGVHVVGGAPARPRRASRRSRSHGTSPKSAATLPPVATSTTEHVQPRSASAAPIASLQVISSSAQTWSARRSRTRSRVDATQLARALATG